MYDEDLDPQEEHDLELDDMGEDMIGKDDFDLGEEDPDKDS